MTNRRTHRFRYSSARLEDIKRSEAKAAREQAAKDERAARYASECEAFDNRPEHVAAVAADAAVLRKMLAEYRAQGLT